MEREAQDAIRAGDIVRERWAGAADEPRVSLYLGSGRCGACFDAWGLMHGNSGVGNTVLMHADHRHRGESGAVEWRPLARLVWAEGPPAPPTDYRQHLELLDGRLTTRLDWPGLRVVMMAQFHPERRDVLGIELTYEASASRTMPPLLLAPEGDHRAGGPTADGMHWATTLTTGSAETVLGVNVLRHEGEAHVRPAGAGARLEFAGPRGRHLIAIGAGAAARGGTVADDLTTWSERHPFGDSATAAWRRRWANADGRGVDRARRAMWARSLYFGLCSIAPEHHAPGPAHGWTGNGPMGSSPRHAVDAVPGFLKFGQLDLAKAAVESCGGAAARTHDLRDVGHVAFAAREASDRLGDIAWTRQSAWPVVHEAARLFAARLKEGPGGMWHLDDAQLAPLARACLQGAVMMAGQLGESGQEFANYRGILSDGIAGADRPVVADEHFAAETDAEQVQFFTPGARTPYHLPSHAGFLRA